MTAKLPYTAISRTMHIHPTVSELVPTMLQEMKRNLRLRRYVEAPSPPEAMPPRPGRGLP